MRDAKSDGMGEMRIAGYEICDTETETVMGRREGVMWASGSGNCDEMGVGEMVAAGVRRRSRKSAFRFDIWFGC